MPYCQECGAEIGDDAAFCPGCGADLSEARDSAGEQTTKSAADFAAGRKAVLGGAAVVCAAAFLPWVSATILGTEISKRGIEADGSLTLIAGGIVIAAALYQWSRDTQTVAVFGGFGIAGL